MSDKKFKCPKCGHKCGSESIYGCESLKCPKCKNVFEPENESGQEDKCAETALDRVLKYKTAGLWRR
jgi:rubredoxin